MRLLNVEFSQGLFPASEVIDCDDQLSHGFMNQEQKHTPLRRCPAGVELPVGGPQQYAQQFFLFGFISAW